MYGEEERGKKSASCICLLTMVGGHAMHVDRYNIYIYISTYKNERRYYAIKKCWNKRKQEKVKGNREESGLCGEERELWRSGPSNSKKL